eukprot:6154221-Pleurochrysis_carterae.AAC.1
MLITKNLKVSVGMVLCRRGSLNSMMTFPHAIVSVRASSPRRPAVPDKRSRAQPMPRFVSMDARDAALCRRAWARTARVRAAPTASLSACPCVRRT